MTKNKDINYEREVCKSVLQAMGKKPKDMFKITAGNVFENNWRVNIWSTKLVEGEYSSLTTSCIEYSYFIKYNNELKTIINSDPPIEKLQ
tara:strand:+ start:3307 stop:3576 length:270 start_codon:yes stop_codon:yes gene_type:complete